MNFISRTSKTGLIAALISASSWSVSVSANESSGKVIHVDANEARVLLSEWPEIQVIDARTRPEFLQAQIPGAQQINYLGVNFTDNLSALDRNTPYLVYCKSGNRSSKAVKIMQQEGFTNIYHLDGGFDEWRETSRDSELEAEE